MYNSEKLILDLLIERGPLYGPGLVNESEGKLKRGTVYVYLERLEDQGLISSRLDEATGPPLRRVYRVTEQGCRIPVSDVLGKSDRRV